MTTNNNNSLSGIESIAVQDKDNDNDNPFAEYMWMREEDEFNKQALEQIREEDFIEQCFEEMLEEEELGMFVPPPHLLPSQQNQQGVDELMNNLNLGVQENIAQQQDIDDELPSSDCEDETEGGSNQDNDRGNQSDKAEDNSEGSSSDVDSDSSSDAPLR